eukprot:TRINITY_DN2462_c0_g1_i4.p1 TRINITY_DN2462_c0_g1~~TRINITY_DN2462_c0_g1_i4.p1  ORF type:complete len:113 (+),score=16.33 TRINITY_DN2462_c0_g1_i4:124-462(+)
MAAKASSNPDFVRPEEIEILKPWIRKTVNSLLGFEEETVVAVAVDCLERHLPREQIKGQLEQLMADSAPTFVELLFKEVPKAREARKAAKRKRGAEGDKKESKESCQKKERS